MSRRLPAYGLVSAFLAAQIGCHNCGDRPGWFTSHAKSGAPCQTVGRTGGCFDAATGQPCPCPPETPGMLMPGGTGPYPPIGAIPGGAPFDELPMPNPSDRIPPSAPPFPAPAPVGDAALPFPSSPGTPVKSGPNK